MIQWHLEFRDKSELKAYYKNPRKITRQQRDFLAGSVKRFGLIDKPIINLDGTIIGGHQRLALIKTKEIECWVPNRLLIPEEVEELNIRLNANHATWDYDILANQFEFTDLLEWGIPESMMLDEFDIPSQSEQKEKKKKTKECPACGHEF